MLQVCGQLPPPPLVSPKRTSDEKVERLVKFILSSDNTQRLSWDSRRIKNPDTGEVTDTPAVSRLKGKASLFYDYEQTYSKPLRVGRSTFYEVVKALTSKQVKSTVAVDYHKVELVNCNKKRLKELIEGEAADAKSPLSEKGAETLKTEMNALFDFVKHGFRELSSLSAPASTRQRHIAKIPCTQDERFQTATTQATAPPSPSTTLSA